MQLIVFEPELRAQQLQQAAAESPPDDSADRKVVEALPNSSDAALDETTR